MKRIAFLIGMLSLSVNTFAQWAEQQVNISQTGYFTGYFKDLEVVDANNVWSTIEYINLQNTKVYNKHFAKTTNGGSTWVIDSINVTPSSLCISNIWPISANECYVAMYNNAAGTDKGGIYKTTNGGTTWSKQTTAAFNGTNSFPDWVCFFNANDGVALGDPDGGYFEIYTTADGGANWTRVPQANIPANVSGEYGSTNNFSHVGNHVWFASTKGNVYHSADKGLHWTSANAGLPTTTESINDIAFTDAQHGIVSKLNQLSVTTDGGATWNLITHAGTFFTQDFDAVPGSNIFVSSGLSPTTGYGTSFSNDNGASWRILDTASATSPALHSGVDFLNTEVGYTGAYISFGITTGAYKYNGNILGVDEIETSTNNSLNIFPNPASNYLKFDVSQNESASLSVCDIVGNIILQEKCPINNNIIDISALANGIYTISLQKDNKKYVAKFVKN
jgi:photosystem II stability/assembly factor-like uncharacterized protein